MGVQRRNSVLIALLFPIIFYSNCGQPVPINAASPTSSRDRGSNPTLTTRWEVSDLTSSYVSNDILLSLRYDPNVQGPRLYYANRGSSVFQRIPVPENATSCPGFYMEQTLQSMCKDPGSDELRVYLQDKTSPSFSWQQVLTTQMNSRNIWPSDEVIADSSGAYFVADGALWWRRPNGLESKLDEYQDSDLDSVSINSVVRLPNSHIYYMGVASSSNTAITDIRFYIRRSTDNGATWETRHTHTYTRTSEGSGWQFPKLRVLKNGDLLAFHTFYPESPIGSPPPRQTSSIEILRAGEAGFSNLLVFEDAWINTTTSLASETENKILLTLGQYENGQKKTSFRLLDVNGTYEDIACNGCTETPAFAQPLSNGDFLISGNFSEPYTQILQRVQTLE